MYFYNIQALRGIASLLVFFAHLVSFKPGIMPDWAVYYGYYLFGPTGVDIFFVISGFVVTLVAFKDSNSNDCCRSAFVFLVKRVIRIYPVYWVVLGGAFLASSFVKLAPDWFPEVSLFKLLTLTTVTNSKVMVAWTLAYEMFFYLVLTLAIFFRKKFFLFLYSWIFFEIIIISLVAVYKPEWNSYIPFNPQILQFCVGCIIAQFIVTYKVSYGRTIFVFGAILFVVMAYVNVELGSWESPYNRVLTLTLPSAMLVYGAVVSEKDSSFRLPGILEFFGNISFSLYLWHQLVFYVGEFYIRNNDPFYEQNKTMMVFFISFLAFLVSIISYNFIEKPSQSYLRKILSK
ncbi:acyltransferase family protein [Aggregatibacter actinomycetemcomitans]|uniref:acyltransferase family protein n=1 Tax=Aggregatibacter actinomycetemcomitans TaxID=714 RepID=UPI00022C0152|nr:acyltransferase [Aggregatibacter actinomycetemcomitans]KOE60511.1 exopolysaccharide biosynthesis protein [Aggregatibacter actinomycetemcomitans serotype c str. D17P-2]